MSDRKLSLLVNFAGTGTLGKFIGVISSQSTGAQKTLKKLNDTLKDQKAALKALHDQVGAGGRVTLEMIEREKSLSAAIEKTNGKIKQQRRLMAKQSAADARGSNARSSGTGNLAVGASIAAPLILAAKAGADFQDGMTDIQQKANLSDASTAHLRDNIIIAARAAKQLPEAMRAGVDTLEGFGVTDAQAVSMIAPIGKAATAYRAEVDDLSRATFAVADNLKVPFEDTARTIDIMAEAGKRGAFEIKDMATYFPALTAAAQGLGQEGPAAVADLSAALQIARKGAGDAASAATNVQNLLAKINTKETIEHFKDFGVDLPAAMKKAAAEGKSPMEAIAELTEKALGGNMSKLSFLFGDMQVQQALRPLIANIDEYREIRAAALKATGVLDADFALRSKNANANARALNGSLQNMALVIGDKLLPRLTPLVDDATVIITKIGEWADKHPGLTDAIVMTAAGVAGLNLALGAGKIIYGSLVGPLQAAANAYTVLRNSSLIASVISATSSGLAAAWGVVSVAATPYVTAMFSAAAATWAVAWPVLAVVAACVLVAAAIAGVVWAFKNWDKITAFVSETWQKIKGVLASIDWLKLGGDMLMGLANGLLGGIPTLLIAIGKVAMAGVDKFKDILGIHSPSRVFMAFGGHISEGLGIGIKKGMKSPLRQAGAMAAGVAGAMSIASAPLPAAAGPTFGDVHFHIHAAPGQSPKDIADAVKKVLEDLASQTRAAKASEYVDDDA